MKFYFLGLILGVALMTGCSAAPAENRSYKENNAECIYKLSSAERVYLITYKDEEYLKTDEYALSKARQEDILHRSGKNNWTVIRPYITYSEIRLQLGVLEKELWLYRFVHD